MKLAVMMAAYNAESYIAHALNSIISQDCAATLDVIVVNDGSTDQTGNVLHHLATKHPEIRIIETENQGVTRARNVGLQALRDDTDLVSFLDADDLLPAGRYARDIELFRSDPELQLTLGTTTMFRQASDDQSGPAKGSETASGRCVQLASGTFRYSMVQRVGLFDTSFQQAEDMDFLLRMLELGPKYHIQDETCIFYRRHGGNMTRDTDQLRRDFSRALLFSVRRRKANNLPPFNTDIFDAQGFVKAHGW